MPADPGPLLLLDGASLWFRAFHAIPEKITAPNGQPVNAVRGFLDMVAALITEYRPGRLVVCLDWDWRPEFRVALISSYKTHRLEIGGERGAEQVPSSLPAQVELIQHILDGAGIATAGAVGFEADDVLGTLADRERSDPVVVVSGDRDLLQLVSDEPVRVRVLYVGRGLAKAELFGPAEVAAKYGVPVENAGHSYADMAILRGDPSDGLPGVPGIGDKTAAALISRFGSLKALLSAADEPSGDLSEKIRVKLLTATAYLSAAPRVVHVTRNAPVELSRPDLLPTEVDTTALRESATRLNAKSPIDRLITALRACQPTS